MLMLFFLFIPEFVATVAGKVFVVIWSLMAVLSFTAYGRSVTVREGRQYVPVYGIKKAERTARRARSTSPMRGL